jgi:uncharacterized damage-inducible protein DinB
MNIAESIVADFDVEAGFSKKLLEAVPEDKLDWRPHEKSWSLGQLAGHIAEAPMWMSSMLGDEFNMDDLADEGYQPFVPTSKAELLEALEKNCDAFRADLEGRDDAFMTAIWRMIVGGKEVMASPRAAVVRSIMLHHVAHHRGQLTVYLRLLDVPVPGTYGGTADFPDAF